MRWTNHRFRYAALLGIAMAFLRAGGAVAQSPTEIPIDVSIGDRSTLPPNASLMTVEVPGHGRLDVGTGNCSSQFPDEECAVFHHPFPSSGFLDVGLSPRAVTWSLRTRRVSYLDSSGVPRFLRYCSTPDAVDVARCGPEGDPAYHCTGSFTARLVASQGALSGQVKDALGNPVPAGTLVCKYDPEMPATADDLRLTDSSGRYEFIGNGPVDRQNNWGLLVDCPDTPGKLGEKTYVLVAGGSEFNCLPIDSQNARPATIFSSEMTVLDLELPSAAPDPSARACPFVGEPVSVATGNVFFDQVDAAIPGVALAGLRFTRSYNSLNVSRGGVFGPGWTHSLERKLTVSGRRITLTGEDGVASLFEDDGAGIFVATVPFTVESRILRLPGGGYRREFRKGGSESYDASGRLTTIRDTSGNVTTLTYDAMDRLVSVTDPGSRALTLTYTGEQLTSLNGPDGLIATYTYAGSLLESIQYPDASGYSFAYNDASQLLTVSDMSGRTLETHTYSGDKAVTSETAGGEERYTLSYEPARTTVTDARGNATVYDWSVFGGLKQTRRVTGPCHCGDQSDLQEWTYDDKGRVLTHTDGLGNTTSYEYDASGDRIAETDALGGTTRYTYDAEGRILTVSRPGGGFTTYSYVAAGPRTISEKVTAASDRTTTIDYNIQGKPEAVTDPRGGRTIFEHHPTGDLKSVTDPMSHRTTFGYDLMGRRTSVTDPLDKVTETAYDGRGRIRSTVNHDGTHTDFAYDLGGRRTSVTDSLGKTTSFVYDPHGRIEKVIDPLAGETVYRYDVMSNLVSLTDAKGQTTGFEYDGHNRVRKVVYPGGAFETFTYDAAGRLGTKTDRKNVTTTLTYDAVGRLTAKSYSNGSPPVSYSYDPAGRLLTAVNSADTLTWSYDLAGQVLSEQSQRNASTVAYSYDDAGNRLSLRLDGAVLFTYSYDADSASTAIRRESNGHDFTFGYQTPHHRTSLAYPNGVTTSYGHDDLYRLTGLSVTLGTTPITSVGYTYDDAGNRTRKTTPAFVEDYAYDGLYHLKDVVRSSGTTESYTYDPVGNRLSTLGVPDWQYNPQNQLLSQDGTTYTYDANGNLAQKVESGDTWTYQWTVENRLLLVFKNGVRVARFLYDALGRRVQKAGADSTTQTRYTYDGEDILRENRVNGNVWIYVHGPGIDEPLAREDQTTGAWRYYHVDALGSRMKTTNSSGAVTRTDDYDAWGQSLDGASPAGYAFTGREWDPETGLYYYRARYYDPKIGRFISEDPIGFEGGINFYAYVRNNPVRYVDPWGLVAWDCKYSVVTGNSPIGPGGGVLLSHCKSECACGVQVTVRIVGSIVGLSASPIPIPGGVSNSSITLHDPFPCPQATSLQGHILYSSVGAATPVGGWSYTWMELGSGSGKGGGFTHGLDAGLDAYGGAGVVVDSSTSPCCGQ